MRIIVDEMPSTSTNCRYANWIGNKCFFWAKDGIGCPGVNECLYFVSLKDALASNDDEKNKGEQES